ncbi:MAG TPA: PilZ domain-containing protein [Kofleriaceae bacterium]|nr:PilZ domain-containing protein [Kofleriaceae bacterium]
MGNKVNGASGAWALRSDGRHGLRERRRSGRVDATGTALVHGTSALHGRIVDLAIGGISLLVEGCVSPPEVGDRVRVSVRLDGVGRWFHVGGSIARSDARGSTTALAIELCAVPQDFEDLVQNELLSVLECACEPQILLVDSVRGRRDLVAAAFRAAGARVVEVSSALEAIAEIDQSRLHLWAVVIADTKIASRADDLRSYLRETYPRVPLIIVGAGRRTRAHLTVDRFPDLALQIHSLVAMRDQIGACA